MISPDIQAYFDREDFDKDGYKTLDRRDEKIRHIQLHVAKAALKMVQAEQNDSQVIQTAVIPDTAVYRSQLINVIGVDNIPNIHRQFPEQPPVLPEDDLEAEQWCFEAIVEASGELATYLERKEHGAPADERNILRAAMCLHAGSLGLAAIYEVDVDEAHLQRLEQNLGRPLPPEIFQEVAEQNELAR